VDKLIKDFHYNVNTKTGLYCPNCGQSSLLSEDTKQNLTNGVYVMCPMCKSSWEIRYIPEPNDKPNKN